MNLSQFVSGKNPAQKRLLKALSEGVKSINFKPAELSLDKTTVNEEFSIHTKKGNIYWFTHQVTLKTK